MKKFVALAILIFSMGCAGPSPGKEDLVGVWQGKGAAELDFSPTGEVTIKGIPYSAVFWDHDRPADSLVEGHGRWTTEAAGRNGFLEDYWPIHLDIIEDGKDSGFYAYYVSSHGVGTVFFMQSEDNPERFELERRRR